MSMAVGWTLLATFIYVQTVPLVSAEEEQPACADKDVFPGLKLKARLSPGQHAVGGAKIYLAVWLENTSQERITFYAPNMFYNIKVTVKDAENTAVPMSRFGKEKVDSLGNIMAAKQIHLDVGESYVFLMDLQRLYDITTAESYTIDISYTLDGKEYSRIEGVPMKLSESTDSFVVKRESKEKSEQVHHTAQ